MIRPLKHIQAITSGGKSVLKKHKPRIPASRAAETTFLVTDMMRSVLNEGTAAGARSAGFALKAAGKTGTTNDLRDAWFVGFTPELLTVVWVGFDDNQPLGLSGALAALPIWTQFMMRALAGHGSISFEPPDDVTLPTSIVIPVSWRRGLPPRLPRSIPDWHAADSNVRLASLGWKGGRDGRQEGPGKAGRPFQPFLPLPPFLPFLSVLPSI